ncbi:hypothetical protein VaNZ11_004361 [Volvox africanus]|uniref:Inner centromere protein ARK-binding domain-containing protein n=1 Tax=Volvox africanus TaxID=51714 RepID=A0ABQ5RX63_9CHLO|nr:hypothetical protein VaNZ11_004361 [Volvox africanus]
MAAVRKVLVTRFQDILANRQEERRHVEELANGLRKDVENLVAKASHRVYQLRGRIVVITTPEGSRRKKAARTNDSQETKPAILAGADEERETGGPAGPVGPAPAGGLEQAQQPGTRPSDEQDRQDAEPVEPDASTAQSGQKRGRGRLGGASKAKSKRAKAQAAQSVPGGALDAAAVPGHGNSQQPSRDGPTIAAKLIDVGADATAALCQNESISEVPSAQLQDDPTGNGARRTRNRVQKQAANQVASGSHMAEEARQPEFAGGVPRPPQSVAFSPRVTRARRAQPAANSQRAAPSAAAKPAGGKSTRQKRDMAEAQLGSPGVHPRTKPATLSGVRVPPAPAVNASTPVAAVTPARNVDPSASSRQTNMGPSACVADLKSMPVAKAMPRLGACPSTSGTDPTVGPQPRETDCSLPLPPTDKPEVDLRKGEPYDLAQQPAAMTVMQPDAGQAVCSKDGAQEWSASSQAENRVHAQQPPSEKMNMAPPDNVRRMGAHIAATIAMFCGKTAPGAAGPSSTARVENAKLDPTGGANAHSAHASKGLAGEMVVVADPTESTNSYEQFFSFGTKPKEHSSPPMPHFGPAVEQVIAASVVMTATATPAEGPDGTPENLPTEADAPEMSVRHCGEASSVLAAEPSNAAERPADHNRTDEIREADVLGDPDVPDVVGGRVSCDDETNNVPDLEATVRGEVRNRSLSLSLAPQSPVVLAAGAAVNTQHAAVDDADPGDIGCPGGSGNDVAEWKTSQAQLCTGADDAEDEADDGCDGALKAPRSNLCCALEEREEVGSEIAAVGYEAEDTQTCFGGKSNDGGGEADDCEEPVACEGSGADTCASTGPAASVQAGAQSGEAQSRLKGCGVGAEMPAQLNKPKGGNLVSSIRSFLPQRTAPSPAPAAGKKPVKVKALEAAQAVKQKQAARQAERARATAVGRQRQGQGDAEPSNAKPGTQAPGSVRLTPTKSLTHQGVDNFATCTTTGGGVIPPTHAASTSTAAPDEKRNESSSGGVPTASVGSVLAKAAFFQLKEEQNRKPAADLGAGRKPAAGVTAVVHSGTQGAVPSYKASANARATLAAGDNEATLSASATAVTAPALVPPSTGANPSLAAAASSRGLNPALPAAPSETVADKQKRVEAKRREEEERRRAELEARTKAKDDKMRNIEAAKQQQRQGGGGGAPRPPPPLIPNPFAAQVTGKRPPLNAPVAYSGPAGAVQVKPEPESNKIGPAGPSAAKTPGPKFGTVKTPAPKAAPPLASNMVSPAVQMQIKLLPAVHSQVPGVDGTKANACAPALPKPKPAGLAKPPQGGAPVAGAADQQTVTDNDLTPGAGDLTEEERRNVRAIQMSPYIMQVKPRTPGMPTSTKPVYANYEISPYRSDSDSDDDMEQSRRGKPVPPWAAHEKILLAVQAQSGINPDTIFGTYPSTIDLVRVFADMPPPGKTDARGRPRRDYRRRGSSGIWGADMF